MIKLLHAGGRTADEIVSWLNKKTGPPSKVLENKEASDKYTEDNDVAVLAFFPVRLLQMLNDLCIYIQC